MKDIVTAELILVAGVLGATLLLVWHPWVGLLLVCGVLIAAGLSNSSTRREAPRGA